MIQWIKTPNTLMNRYVIIPIQDDKLLNIRIDYYADEIPEKPFYALSICDKNGIKIKSTPVLTTFTDTKWELQEALQKMYNYMYLTIT